MKTIIERICGILKRCFCVCLQQNEFPFVTQVKLIYSATALHNFILHHEQDDMEYFSEHANLKKKEGLFRYVLSVTESAEMQKKIDDIAKKNVGGRFEFSESKCMLRNFNFQPTIT